MIYPATSFVTLQRMYSAMEARGAGLGDAAMRTMWDLGRIYWPDNDDGRTEPCDLAIAAELIQGGVVTRSSGISIPGGPSRDLPMPGGGILRLYYNC